MCEEAVDPADAEVSYEAVGSGCAQDLFDLFGVQDADPAHPQVEGAGREPHILNSADDAVETDLFHAGLAKDGGGAGFVKNGDVQRGFGDAFQLEPGVLFAFVALKTALCPAVFFVKAFFYALFDGIVPDDVK